ncbi:MAG: hypothetical protein J1F64_04780 [Oscillospiraceae bacterium]|nr:hypothetical protein [Oscillospiraceae bacterium]
MKKSIILILSAAIFGLSVGLSAAAREQTEVTYEIPAAYSEDTAALALFSGGALSYCGLYTIEKTADDGFYITVGSDIASKGDTAKIILFESGEIINAVPSVREPELPEKSPDESAAPADSPEPTASPEQSASPKPTAVPEQSATPEITLNPVYPKEIDAVSAFAVVEKVTKTIIDDEIMYNVNVLYQGRERIFYIEPDVYISSAPEIGPFVTGSEAGALKEGDIISVKSSLSGKINDLVLVMRPPSKDILTSGKDYGSSFEYLYSKNYVPSAYSGDSVLLYGSKNNSRVKYAFGVITDKNSSSFTLRGADGKSNHSFDIDFDKNTCVYGIDADNANDVSIQKPSYIRKSAIPKAYFDDRDNISEWDRDCDYTYALVRIVDDCATDIAIITY